jgi:hypothetical protein
MLNMPRLDVLEVGLAGSTSGLRRTGENRRKTHRRKSSSNVQKLPTTAMT